MQCHVSLRTSLRGLGIAGPLEFRFTFVSERPVFTGKNLTTKLRRTTLGAGLARTGTNTGTPRRTGAA